jgi:hypothetical protein
MFPEPLLKDIILFLGARINENHPMFGVIDASVEELRQDV